MANKTNEENWAARERLRVLEMLLWWRGWVGRSDLLERFGISAAQASSDFQKYLDLNGRGISYQTRRKRYEAAEDFTCRLHEPSLDEAVRVLLAGEVRPAAGMVVAGNSEKVAILALPKREALPGIGRRVVMALLAGGRLRVFYHSLSSNAATWRYLRPAALAWDGRRWNVRAWCENRREWRDFVLGRMSKADWPEPAEEVLPADEDWQTWETVRLRINPELGAEARAALKMDYGLENEVMEVRVRRALRGYLLAEMFVDGEGHGTLPNHFVMAAE
jgi:predicted DNA-binding transcriptional regulator YafY